MLKLRDDEKEVVCIWCCTQEAGSFEVNMLHVPLQLLKTTQHHSHIFLSTASLHSAAHVLTLLLGIAAIAAFIAVTSSSLSSGILNTR